MIGSDPGPAGQIIDNTSQGTRGCNSDGEDRQHCGRGLSGLNFGGPKCIKRDPLDGAGGLNTQEHHQLSENGPEAGPVDQPQDGKDQMHHRQWDNQPVAWHENPIRTRNHPELVEVLLKLCTNEGLARNFRVPAGSSANRISY